MAEILDESTLRERVRSLDGWTVQDGKLHREFEFDDFSSAFGFLSRVALAAEKAGHHPDIHNSYASVTLDLVSHDAGGITERDLEMARAIDALGG